MILSYVASGSEAATVHSTRSTPSGLIEKNGHNVAQKGDFNGQMSFAIASKVTFATSCWEKDWRLILLTPDYLKVKQIAHHCYPFSEKLLVINNVENLEQVKQIAQEKVDQGILTRYVVAADILSHFDLKRADFNEWQYYNAIAPLTAILEASSEYLLYLTGDVYLEKPVHWIQKAIRFMQKESDIKVANLNWNDKYREAKKESYRRTWNFFVANQGFSDQLFLVKKGDFDAPIYGQVRADGAHYPRGDVFEKRVFSFLKNQGFRRITYRHGSYTHIETTAALPSQDLRSQAPV